MQEAMRPVIPKAPVHNLRVNVARTGLAIGDTAELHLTTGGDLGVFAMGRHFWMGMLPQRKLLHLGELGPDVAALMLESVMLNLPTRLRIVGLTPEHLAGDQGPEIFVSVWASLHAAPMPRPMVLG